MSEHRDIPAVRRRRPSLDEVVDQLGVGVLVAVVVAVTALVIIPDGATMPSLLLPAMSVAWFLLMAGVAWVVAWWRCAP